MQSKQEIIELLDILPIHVVERFRREMVEEKEKNDKKKAYDRLMYILENTPSVPDDTVYDEYKEMRLRERGLL
jgi:hypothetical protein